LPHNDHQMQPSDNGSQPHAEFTLGQEQRGAPAMTICGTGPRYQGRPGISRGYLLVRTGALNSPRAFLPAMPALCKHFFAINYSSLQF